MGIRLAGTTNGAFHSNSKVKYLLWKATLWQNTQKCKWFWIIWCETEDYNNVHSQRDLNL